MPALWSAAAQPGRDATTRDGHELHVLVDVAPVMYRVWVEEDPSKCPVGSLNGR